ncbi:unnamed protein product [Boreogadus saida]
MFELLDTAGLQTATKLVVYVRGHSAPSLEPCTDVEQHFCPGVRAGRFDQAYGGAAGVPLEPASCPAGAAVGAVANQISAIHLTKLTMPSLSASFSPHPPLRGEEEYDGGVKLSGNECFAKQMEGEEEEFPDEVEKGCDDDASRWLEKG